MLQRGAVNDAWRGSVIQFSRRPGILPVGFVAHYQELIRGLAVRIAHDTTMIQCMSLADRMRMVEALMGAVRAHAAELGLPTTIRVTDASPPTEEQARAVGQAPGGVASIG